MNLFCSALDLYYLCTATTVHVIVINRESGENPVQSRCCDFREVPIILCHCSVWGGKAHRDGISQKTCKAIIVIIACEDVH